MRYRQLGRTGLEVSELTYGTWGIGKDAWGGGDDGEALRALGRAMELGVTLIDTALAYGDGHSERLVGKALETAPDGVHVATKVPPKVGGWPPPDGVHPDEVLPADWVIDSAEQSLRNLGVDAIDLLQLHVWSDEWVGRGSWPEAVERLKADGKVRFVGVSVRHVEPANGVKLLETGLVDTVQAIYNMFEQIPEDELFPVVREHDLGMLARVPFDEGGLTGKVWPDTDFEPEDFRSHYFRGSRAREVSERVDAIAGDLGVPRERMPEMALRFCVSDPAVSTVVTGMRSLRNVEANVRAIDAGPLSEEERKALKRHRWVRDWHA